jgi:CheY-like chemotaxis protein
MKRSILVIEENRSLRYLITTLFTNIYIVRSVENNRQAMLLFNSGYNADLIILDVADMKSENLELLEHVSTSSIFSNVPVIVLSSSHDEDLKNICLQSGANDFLTKPFNPVYLFEKADELLLSEHIPDVIHKRKRLFSNLNIF